MAGEHELSDSPFDTIESAQRFVDLLLREVEHAKKDLDENIADAAREEAARRIDALRLAHFKLKQLADHLTESRRALNDLRTIRRLLAGERARS